jgi:hypothetical protein
MIFGFMFCTFLSVMGCETTDIQSSQSTEILRDFDGEKITFNIENGPISVELFVHPKQPKLGDPITLDLQVQATESLTVKMPPFGEALGRFQIANFQPQESREDGDKRNYQQRYTLQAPMSGLQKIPALRIVYIDPSIDTDEREILTDDIAIEIQSLLEEDAPLTLSSPKNELIVNRELENVIFPILSVLGIIVLSIFGIWYYRKHQHKVMIQNAYLDALSALVDLQSQDFEGRLDAFYAELSLIIRRYISSRFGLKAVEKTTEEFLFITKTSQDITEVQRLFVGNILQTCDMMKFTKEKQSGLDHQTQLQAVRKFLDETTPMEDRVS